MNKNLTKILCMAGSFLFSMHFSFAQNAQILGILNGNSQASQAVLTIAQPQQAAKQTSVSVGNAFPSGSTISTPQGTTVKIGANGNQQEILPNSQHQVRYSPKMETHKTLTGKVIHHVNNKPDGYTYRASGNTIFANPHGTVFSVDVQGKKANFSVIEGQIVAVEKVNLKVSQQSQNYKTSKDRPLIGTKATEFSEGQSMSFDEEMEDVMYDTYEDAINAYKNQLGSDQYGYVDAELMADDNMVLGELYLDEGMVNEAIGYFNQAIRYYNQLDFAEIDIAEASLLIAEAYYMAEDYGNVDRYARQAIAYIQPVMEYDREDYQYAYEDQDYYLMEEIAFDLFFDYDYMGWAYELLGYPDTAQQYYDAADSLGVSGY